MELSPSPLEIGTEDRASDLLVSKKSNGLDINIRSSRTCLSALPNQAVSCNNLGQRLDVKVFNAGMYLKNLAKVRGWSRASSSSIPEAVPEQDVDDGQGPFQPVARRWGKRSQDERVQTKLPPNWPSSSQTVEHTEFHCEGLQGFDLDKRTFRKILIFLLW